MIFKSSCVKMKTINLYSPRCGVPYYGPWMIVLQAAYHHNRCAIVHWISV